MGTDSKPAARAARTRGRFGERGLDADGISAGAGRGIANLGANRGLAWCPPLFIGASASSCRGREKLPERPWLPRLIAARDATAAAGQF